MSKLNGINGHTTGKSVVAIVNNEDVAAKIQTWCDTQNRDDASIQVHDMPLLSAVNDARAHHQLLIVQTSIESEQTVQAIETMAKSRPAGTSLLVILEAPSAGDVRRLFRAGVADVLAAEADFSEFNTALSAATNQIQLIDDTTRGKGSVLTVLKTAGGVGATTIATNLAREFAAAGAEKIVVVDMDVQFGQVSVALDLAPRLTLLDALRAEDRLDAALVVSLMTRHKSGFDVLAAAPEIAPSEIVTPSFTAALLDTLKSVYDIVILDMPMNWSAWFSEAFVHSDLIIPVVEPSVRSADGARRLMGSLADIGSIDAQVIPVANKADPVPAVADRLKNFVDIFGTNCDQTIRSDRKTADHAADRGLAMRDVSASAAITTDLEEVAYNLSIAAGLSVDLNRRSKSDRIRKIPFLGGRI